ncbi:MAG TPA: hypothetical protein VGK59_18555 [Ohtaekwangia sp.]
MTHEEKINYMRIAAGIAGYSFDTKNLDMLVSLYELVIEKQGETDLKTVCKIETEVKDRANVKSRSELLDKVSEKV